MKLHMVGLAGIRSPKFTRGAMSKTPHKSEYLPGVWSLPATGRVSLSIEVAKYLLLSTEAQVEKRSLPGHWSGPAASAKRPPRKGAPARAAAPAISRNLWPRPHPTTAAAHLSKPVTEDRNDVRLHQAPKAS